MTRHGGVGREGRRKKENLEVPSLAPEEVFIGKDVLELVTTAMHVDPITVYREYIQNAADAIDEARRCGRLAPLEPGRVNIDVDPLTRSVCIRDNGVGVPWPRFVECLTAIGASSKRGTSARGFRGVGRLAGLGYAQELVFRSRVAGETLVSELRWDCRMLKSALRSAASNGGVSELVRSIVTATRIERHGYPERFFEVELRGMVRLGSDKLLNPTAIAEYLAQVAPVPFAPDFRFGAEITAALRGAVTLGELELHVSGVEGPIYRPHRNGFAIDSKRVTLFENVEFVEMPSIDGQVAAIGWVLHHGYEGAVPISSLIRGLRLRCGNLQVGDHTLLEELFPEPRFNAWSVGEIHVIDPRILPNGRRDNFEQDAHLNNLLNHLTPVARRIARRCRVSSRKRHLLRQFELEEASIRDRLAILAQAALSAAKRESSAKSIEQGIRRMEKILSADDLLDCGRSHLEERVTATRTELQRLVNEPLESSPLGHLPANKRKMYEHLFELVYECSTNRVAAKALVDRILIKLQATEAQKP
jgi:molecular chaperone HtpG